ncbi:hypothetical protein OQA88_7967 [Cercophora sp. LCS_1]
MPTYHTPSLSTTLKNIFSRINCIMYRYFRFVLAAALSALLLQLVAASSQIALGAAEQQPLGGLEPSSAPVARNFSVGFSLHSSYGAAAIIFSYPDGKRETHTTVYHGSSEYRRVMAKLSLESSRHIAPPYNDDGEYWADQPRKALRLAAKLSGLPASYEVGILADTLRHLRSQLQGAFGIQVTEAVFAAPHLVALYQDDLEDAAEHLGIRYVTPKHEFLPLVWETSAAYAGHGFGLCPTWWDDQKCMAEDREESKVLLFAVHYSRSALTVSLAKILHSATSLYEPDWRHAENYTLGQDALAKYDRAPDYWGDVKSHLLSISREYPSFEKPDLVLITGNAADGEFKHVLEEALMEDMGRVPPFIDRDPVVVAAKGAAEFMRRGPAPWSS